ncbi:MAG: hypothetical protein HW416_960 [Chloroflexi bacterium]|nr:hypothetical protein [Chloroflexota bacterium]
MHVTPSLDQSYAVACDTPAPALTYAARGHNLTVVIDEGAVTAFRRDASGTTPLDRLDLLEDDFDELGTVLGLPRAELPKNFGALYRTFATRGIRLVANEDAVRAANIRPEELDPAVQVVTGEEVRKLLSDLDAFLPYDDIGPMHPIFSHRPH